MDPQKVISNKLLAHFGLSGFDRSMSDLKISSDKMYRIELPEKFTTADLKRAQKDFEELGRIVREHTEEMVLLNNAIIKSDFKT